MSHIFDKPTGIAYFDELESPAFSSIQTVWDRVAVNRMGSKFVSTSFNKDMLSLGYACPSGKDMNRFIAAIEAGSIDRPEREGALVTRDVAPAPAEPSNDEQVATVDPVAEAAPHEVIQPTVASILNPLVELIVGQAPETDPVSTLRDWLMSEAVAELQRDIEVQARRLVATRMRHMADAFERGEV